MNTKMDTIKLNKDIESDYEYKNLTEFKVSAVLIKLYEDMKTLIAIPTITLEASETTVITFKANGTKKKNCLKEFRDTSNDYIETLNILLKLENGEYVIEVTKDDTTIFSKDSTNDKNRFNVINDFIIWMNDFKKAFFTKSRKIYLVDTIYYSMCLKLGFDYHADSSRDLPQGVVYDWLMSNMELDSKEYGLEFINGENMLTSNSFDSLQSDIVEAISDSISNTILTYSHAEVKAVALVTDDNVIVSRTIIETVTMDYNIITFIGTNVISGENTLYTDNKILPQYDYCKRGSDEPFNALERYWIEINKAAVTSALDGITFLKKVTDNPIVVNIISPDEPQGGIKNYENLFGNNR